MRTVADPPDPKRVPDPRLVAAVNELADGVKRNARLAARARADLVSSSRAFLGPTFRAVGYVCLIVLLVAGEARRNRPSD
jgi:hypothetical protein